MRTEKDAIYVCLSTNDEWAPFAAVTIASIMSNTRFKVHFFILYSDLGQENIHRINSLSQAFNMEIDYIYISQELLSRFKLDISYITNDTFSKLLFADIIKDVDKVIYTDVDVVFKKDISELFNEDLEGKIIGAVEGISHTDGKDNIRLTIGAKHNYFQAGLLLIDCKKWREQNITLSCYDILKTTSKLRYGDQDLLNIVFANNRYKKLHQKYCVIPFQLDKMQTFSKDSCEALADPFIIHYAGGNKPWITSGPLEKDFWKYASMTDFFLDIVKMRLNSDFVSKNRNIKTKQYNLFGLIPLMKIKRKFMYLKIIERYFLFNCIPILKKVDDVNSIIWTSFFGLPILHLTKEKNEQR